MKFANSLAGVAFLLTGTTAVAQSNLVSPDRMPEAFKSVLECKSATDDKARLACFDQSIESLDQARQRNDILIVTKEEVREARRGLFGISLPKIRLFGSGNEDEGAPEELNEISSTIAAVGRGQRGLVLKLADGAVWEQTDKVYLGDVQEGDPITIKRAALGSYMAKIRGSRGARVKRIE